MPAFNTAGVRVLGDDLTDQRFAFDRTHIGGETTAVIEDFTLGNAAAEVIGVDVNIITSSIRTSGTDTGIWDLTGGSTIIQQTTGSNYNGNNDYTDKILTNHTYIFEGDAYCIFGPWGGGSSTFADHQHQGTVFSGAVVQADSSTNDYLSCGMFTLFLRVDPTTSFFRGLQYWNGVAPNNSSPQQGTRGAIPMFTTRFKYDEPVMGPQGGTFNNETGARNNGYRLVRRNTAEDFFGTNTNPDNASYWPDSHTAHFYGADMRGWALMDGPGLKIVWAVDGHSNAVDWNPLIGIPETSNDGTKIGGFIFATAFRRGVARTVVATNPETTTNWIRFAFDSTQVVLQPEANATVAGSAVTPLTTQNLDNPTNGFGVQHQMYSETTIRNNNYGNATTLPTGSMAITAPDEKQYRAYAWNEQANAAQFGELQRIIPPSSQAGVFVTDEVVATARDNGYDRILDSGWATSTPKNWTTDNFIVQSGFASPTAALTEYNATAETRTGSDVPTAIKALTLGRTLPTDNSKLTLHYSRSGTTGIVDTPVTLDGSATAVSGTVSGNGYSDFTIPALDILQDESCTALTATQFILDSTFGAGEQTNKVILNGTTTFDILADGTYNNLTINGNVGGRRIGHTIDGLNIIGTGRELSVIGYTADSTVSIEAIVGTNFSSESSVTINSSVAITIVTDQGGFTAGTNVTISQPINFAKPSGYVLRVFTNTTAGINATPALTLTTEDTGSIILTGTATQYIGIAGRTGFPTRMLITPSLSTSSSTEDRLILELGTQDRQASQASGATLTQTAAVTTVGDGTDDSAVITFSDGNTTDGTQQSQVMSSLLPTIEYQRMLAHINSTTTPTAGWIVPPKQMEFDDILVTRLPDAVTLDSDGTERKVHGLFDVDTQLFPDSRVATDALVGGGTTPAIDVNPNPTTSAIVTANILAQHPTIQAIMGSTNNLTNEDNWGITGYAP